MLALYHVVGMQASISVDMPAMPAYTYFMQQKAPVSALTLTRACNPTQPKPYQTLNLIIRLSVVELKERFHDLSQLPDRM